MKSLFEMQRVLHKGQKSTDTLFEFILPSTLLVNVNMYTRYINLYHINEIELTNEYERLISKIICMMIKWTWEAGVLDSPLVTLMVMMKHQHH